MTDLTAELALIADQLRALANNGLHFTDDPYQIERFHTVLALAARLLSMTDARPAPEIAKIFRDDLTVRTPLAVVDTAVFDDDGRLLLIQRDDNRLWALPGGACDVGEAPATAGAREVWEETGYQIEPTTLLGVFDSRLCGQNSSRHLYHFLFVGKPIGGQSIITDETTDVRWFSAGEIPWSVLSPGHAPRIRFAMDWKTAAVVTPFFDREALLYPPTRHHQPRPPHQAADRFGVTL